MGATPGARASSTSNCWPLTPTAGRFLSSAILPATTKPGAAGWLTDKPSTRVFWLPYAPNLNLTCRLVGELQPIVQGHTIEGLMMGKA